MQEYVQLGSFLRAIFKKNNEFRQFYE